MRELEFLPEWYPKLRKRKRGVALQGWVTLTVSVVLAGWVVAAQRDVRARERELSQLDQALTHSVGEVTRLNTLLDLQTQLRAQDQVFAKIGRPVEMTRLLTTLDQLMPANMAVLNLSVQTEEPRPDTLAQRVAQDRGVQRRITMRMTGVAPTDADLANFMSGLTAKPFFKNVAVSYSRPRTQEGHSMREFEVAFSLDLGLLGGN